MTLGDVNWLYPLAGLLVGLLVGITGVGGGSLMTPLLVLLFGFHPATAVGTDLLYAAITKSAGTATHHRHGTVDWTIVGRMAAGSVPAAIATLLFLSTTGPMSDGNAHVITLVLGVVLLLTALALLFQQRVMRYASGHSDDWAPAHAPMLTVALGAVLGVLVSISSVGAGAIGMTALIMLYPRMPVVRLIGSDIAHAVPLTLVAGLGHWWMGSVDPVLLVALLVGSIPGIIIGSLVGARLPESILRPVLAAVLVLVGVKLLLS